MKESLISFETAKLAYRKGYTRETVGISFTSTRKNYYNKEGELNGDCIDFIKDVIKHGRDKARINHILYPATSQSLLQKWLREVHNIDVVLSPERYSNGINYLVQAQKWDLNADPEVNPNFVIKGSYWFNDNHEYETYEEALEKGLQEALKLIEI